MATLLFPGRHLLNTRFQEKYLFDLLQLPVSRLPILGSSAVPSEETLEQIVFAVTSANQENSRYNPIPFHVRAIGLDRFARELLGRLNIGHHILGIPHYGPTFRFAENTLKEIDDQMEGSMTLSPENTLVLCSTPEVIKSYQRLGFAVLPAELDTGSGSLSSPKYKALTPMEVLKKVVDAGENWSNDPEVCREISTATFSLWTDFPEVPKKVLRLYRDPLLNDGGSLTDSRNYSAYAFGMSNSDIMNLKYRDIKEVLLPGKIVDEGCADGALLTFIAKDFPDSDLIGIELTGEFLARCRERHRTGEFGGTYVHFHQRNLMDRIFEDNSIDTTICNSTTHELWSYGEQEKTLCSYLQAKFRQTRKNGRLVIRDVAGPEDKEQEVYLWCNDQDGSNENQLKECSTGELLVQHLQQLSTFALFKRFAQDYLAEMRRSGRRGEETRVTYREEMVDGKRFIVTSLKNAAEFITKKDYFDNWKSELQEEFAFWSFSEWKKALQDAGFQVKENPNLPEQGSRAYINPWMVEHRFAGKVELYDLTSQGMRKRDYPVTNMVLVADKVTDKVAEE